MEAGRQVRKEAGIERIRYPSAGCQIIRIRTGFVAIPCGGKLQQQQYPGDADEDFRNVPSLTSFVPALLFRVGLGAKGATSLQTTQGCGNRGPSAGDCETHSRPAADIFTVTTASGCACLLRTAYGRHCSFPAWTSTQNQQR